MKYFLHDTNAFQDEKITELFMAHGYEGLGLFYSILEKLAQQEKPVKTTVLKQQLSVGKKLEKCWTFLESLQLISSNNGETFNDNLLKFSEKYQVSKEKNREKVSQWREKQALKESVTGYVPVRNGPKVKISKVNTTDVVAAAAPEHSKAKSQSAPMLDEDEPTFNFASSFFNTDKWLAVVADVQKTARYAEADFAHYRVVIGLADDTAPQVLANRHWRKKLMNWLENDAASKNGIVKPVATSQPKGRGGNEMTFELNPTAVARRRREAEEMERTIIAANLARINRNEGTNFTVAGVLGHPSPA